ncbi:MAG: DPP IV N-terminal domain-containing protein [Pirellulales bacterium]
MRRIPEQTHEIHMVESSPRDQTQPKLITKQYLKPGDRVAVSKPHLFDLEAGKEIRIDDKLFAEPWSIDRLEWEADSVRFTFLFNQRGHQVLRFLAVTASTGETKPVIDEVSKTFIDYSGKLYLHRTISNEIIWMSERDGWNHLYLIDAKSGSVKNRLTQGDWVVRGVDLVDERNRQIWFRAGGIAPEQDPYHIHFCRVDFDGKNLVRLTVGDGTHEIAYSPDKSTYIDTYSRIDLPPIHELRRTSDGKLLAELERADWTALVEAGWTKPERFVAKGRDGKTDIYGAIFRPTRFDTNRTYPVIERIYAGPHSSFVPKKFSEWHGNLQTYAELGFILVQIDGMGTSNRSKAFHDVCWKNLVDAGFPDRILWMKAAAAQFPTLDLTARGHLRRFGRRTERVGRVTDARRFLQGRRRGLRVSR